ncbi:hypothetical protein K1719_011628 [Acacia pycnantha]|nr:hypothetical protein K1719_011628 [Acacia pycnantha]
MLKLFRIFCGGQASFQRRQQGRRRWRLICSQKHFCSHADKNSGFRNSNVLEQKRGPPNIRALIFSHSHTVILWSLELSIKTLKIVF